jgi:hypothetical protein
VSAVSLLVATPISPRWPLGVVLPDGALLSFGVDVVGVLACGVLVWAFGHVLARRDVVDGGSVYVPSGPVRRPVDAVGRVVLPPLLTTAWTLLLTAGVLAFSPSFGVRPTFLVSLAIAVTVRTAAHCNEDFSTVVVTMLPAALLGVVVLDCGTGATAWPTLEAVGRLGAEWRTLATGLVLLLGLEAALWLFGGAARRFRSPTAT